MKPREMLLLFCTSLLVLALVAARQPAPGYMDAEYYYAGGIQLADGQGFYEPYIWNYLDSPIALPRPSHAYWMPLASILAALGMIVARTDEFWAARLGFVGLAAALAPLTALLAYRMTRTPWKAWLAGGLAVIPGFYLVYLGTTDTFSVYAVLGVLWFLCLPDQDHKLPGAVHFASLGVISGLMHLSRADGVLWLAAALAAMWATLRREGWRQFLPAMGGLAAGYLLVMGPWFYRNFTVFGSVLSPASTKALWLTNYNELYSYPADVLTPQRWLAVGIPTLLAQRWEAFVQNLQSLLVVQGSIFLAPLMLAGSWQQRASMRVRLALVGGLLTFGVMTLVFPLAGWRGGYFHSGIAVQPLLWAVVPTGLERLVMWGAHHRGWRPQQAIPVFGTGLVLLSLVISAFTVYQKTFQMVDGGTAWTQSLREYQRLETVLVQAGAQPGDVVMVNNPPGYYVAARRPGIAIPDGDERLAVEVGRKYGARFVLLDANHPAGLAELFNSPRETAFLRYLMEYDGFVIFEIE